jgi:peptidoglycan/LPS O-acetylase OafA/YrhL
VARGVSALIVLVAHSCQTFLARLTTDPNSWFAAIYGNAARQSVLVFFLLSGFLITRSITANVRRNGFFDPSDYSFSRVARIYPPFLFALAMAMLVAFIVHYFDLPGGTRPLGDEPLRVRDHLEFTVSELWHALAMQSGMTLVNGPLWTLYIEVKIYFLAMSVALVGFGQNRLYRLAGIGLFAAGLWAIQSDYSWGVFLTAWLVGSATTRLRANRINGYVAAVSGLIIATALLCGPIRGSNVMDTGANKILQILCCLIYARILLVSDVLEFEYPEALRRTGDFSYTLYVTHFSCMVLCLSLLLPVIGGSWTLSVAAQFCAMAASIAFAMWTAPTLENVPFYRRLVRDAWMKTLRLVRHEQAGNDKKKATGF